MHARTSNAGLITFLLAILLGGAVLASLSMGYISVPVKEILLVLSGQGSDHPLAETFKAVVLDVRLPRILTCATVGAALSVSGVLFQGILLNPLADPYTLGVSAGAAFGASVAILLNLSAAYVSIPLFAFCGACITLFFVIFLSYSADHPARGLSSNNLILAGIIIASILSAGISFLKFLANEQVSVIIFWLMGSFASKTWAQFWTVLAALILGTLIAAFHSRDLNLISLGDKSAASLGVNLRKVTLALLLTGSLLAAVCVSISGIIGFVGLLIPHMVRMMTGPDNRTLIPLSLLAGASLLLCADTLTRTVLPHELPIGVLTALTGGPLFCWIFMKNRSR